MTSRAFSLYCFSKTVSAFRKCVITAAYSNANPQVAAAWSTNLTDCGASFSLVKLRDAVSLVVVTINR